jgi:hypothetical protein
MPSGNQPTASVSNRSVTVSWAASAFVGGASVGGYVAKRYNASNQAQTVLSNCSGTISALTCTENAVPVGTWQYSVTPKHSNWVGTESAKSVAATVAAPSLSFSSSTTITALPTTLNGTVANYIPGQTMTYRLDDPTTGTVLTGTTTPSPIQSSGTANISVTIPAGTSNGSHTVYAMGSQGDIASQGITVSVCSPSSQTVNPDRDSYVKQDAATTNFGAATNLDVKSDSSNSKTRRSLVHFALPAIPSACTVTSATLRLFATSGPTGRTINANRATGSWTETGVTWNNQPSTTGSAVGAASVAGWVTWSVTTQVQAMYSGTNDGFSIRDANELLNAVTQSYSSREAASNKPELVLNFG